MILRYSPNTISPDCDVSLSSVDAMLNFFLATLTATKFVPYSYSLAKASPNG